MSRALSLKVSNLAATVGDDDGFMATPDQLTGKLHGTALNAARVKGGEDLQNAQLRRHVYCVGFRHECALYVQTMVNASKIS
jgi:hypothetical protein